MIYNLPKVPQNIQSMQSLISSKLNKIIQKPKIKTKSIAHNKN